MDEFLGGVQQGGLVREMPERGGEGEPPPDDSDDDVEPLEPRRPRDTAAMLAAMLVS